MQTFLCDELIPGEVDEVSRLIADRHDPEAFTPIASLTVGEFREWLLQPEMGKAALRAVCAGLTPEMVAAVSKIMRLQDLIVVAAKSEVVTRFRSTIGLSGRLSTRNQPTDDSLGIAISAIDSLMR